MKKIINMELFKKHVNLPSPILILKNLYNVDNREKNNELVNIIKSGLSDLKDEIENMSENEKELNNQIEWCILLKNKVCF